MPWSRSRHPLLWGWYVLVVILAIPSLRHNCFISPDMNCDPWSLKSTLGRPVLEKTSTSPSATDQAADMSRNGITSGYLDARQMVVSKYLKPLTDRGNGPTMSVAIFSKGSDSTGIHWFGARDSTALLVTWQTGQVEQWARTSLWMPGQV